MRKLFLLLPLLAGLIFPAVAEPFSDEWNFTREIFAGPVKRIEKQFDQALLIQEFLPGGKLRKSAMTAAGGISYFMLVEYDQNGKPISISAFEKEGEKPIYVETAEYGGDGNLRRIVRTGRNAMASSMIMLHPNGLVRQVTVQSGKDLIDWSFEFDGKGALRKSMVAVNGITRGSAFYRNDDHGNVIFAERFNERGEPAGQIRNQYRYDRHGNWIEKKSEFGQRGQNAVKSEVVTRSIEYY